MLPTSVRLATAICNSGVHLVRTPLRQWCTPLRRLGSTTATRSRRGSKGSHQQVTKSAERSSSCGQWYPELAQLLH